MCTTNSDGEMFYIKLKDEIAMTKEVNFLCFVKTKLCLQSLMIFIAWLFNIDDKCVVEFVFQFEDIGKRKKKSQLLPVSFETLREQAEKLVKFLIFDTTRNQCFIFFREIFV